MPGDVKPPTLEDVMRELAKAPKCMKCGLPWSHHHYDEGPGGVATTGRWRCPDPGAPLAPTTPTRDSLRTEWNPDSARYEVRAASAPPASDPRPPQSTQYRTGGIMDSRGHIHMLEQETMDETMRRIEKDRAAALEGATLRHTGFVTKEPMPAACEPRRVLKALDEIADHPDPDGGHPALAPLTPFERGYVLGVRAEYKAWRATR